MKTYSKIMDLKSFCKRYLNLKRLDLSPEMDAPTIFNTYKHGKIKINKDAKITGRAVKKGFFATPEPDFKNIKMFTPEYLRTNTEIDNCSKAAWIAAAFGIEYQTCTDLIVMSFLANDYEVRKPKEKDANSNPNWMSGGKTKNIITESAQDGVREVVIKPLLANRIVDVDYIGHVYYTFKKKR